MSRGAWLTAMSMMLLLLVELRGVQFVPPMTRVCVVLYRVNACHWMPNSAALSLIADQRLDEHLRAPDVELLDDQTQVVVQVGLLHDHERVVRGVRGDRGAVRRKDGAAAAVLGDSADAPCGDVMAPPIGAVPPVSAPLGEPGGQPAGMGRPRW